MNARNRGPRTIFIAVPLYYSEAERMRTATLRLPRDRRYRRTARHIRPHRPSVTSVTVSRNEIMMATRKVDKELQHEEVSTS